MSGEPAAHSAPPSNNSFMNRQQDSETQPSMSGTQPNGRETQLEYSHLRVEASQGSTSKEEMRP